MHLCVWPPTDAGGTSPGTETTEAVVASCCKLLRTATAAGFAFRGANFTEDAAQTQGLYPLMGQRLDRLRPQPYDASRFHRLKSRIHAAHPPGRRR